ncbi:MAG: formylglycine-generating enzyme family protein [Deltaproteobacteria bacterium]|nr:formylglycine-generating enzyme family protein [Deltaproteobacteria bacterium]
MKRAAAVGVVLYVVGTGTGCREESLPPFGQVQLFLMTDAVLPAAPGEPSLPLPPLFDRAYFEIFRPGESVPCAGCTREVALDARTVGEGRASIGIRPLANQAGYRARVRLYRGANGAGADVPGYAAIEQVVALPVVSDEGIVDATVTLRTDDLGRRIGTLEQPVPVTPGAPQERLVGTWEGARRIDCAELPRPGEVCVPGGAFWMGDPKTLSGTQFNDDPQRPKLVVLSPFFLDATEVTVRRFRASGVADPEAVIVTQPIPFKGDPLFVDPLFTAEIAPYHWCNYTREPDTLVRDGVAVDDLPVNCVSQPRARAYCQASGADLPSEAQYEYVAGALESRPFTWGNDEPTCDDAVWGRAGVGILRVLWADCRPPTEVGGPRVPGSGRRDRLVLPTGTIVDLLGNVVEWTRDVWARSTEPCWTFSLARDPVCTTPSATDAERFVGRGGAWGYPGLVLRPTFRQRSPGVEPFGAFGGFRCARAARPSLPPR